MSTATVTTASETAPDFLRVPLRTAAGETVGTVELPAAVFDVPLNVPLLHQVVLAQRAAARQGTADTKTRGEVSGGGKKPYRQKGTGRARQGSTRAPQFAGGGVAHGPTPRSYEQRTPKKMKAAALRGALSDRARSGAVHVLTAVVEGQVPSTKSAKAALQHTCAGRRLLVVVGRGDELGWRSLRNLDQVHLLWADQLNTYDVLVSDEVVFTQPALEAFLASPVAAKAGAGRTRQPAEATPRAYGATAITALAEVEPGADAAIEGSPA